jgi:hypothetical protein
VADVARAVDRKAPPESRHHGARHLKEAVALVARLPLDIRRQHKRITRKIVLPPIAVIEENGRDQLDDQILVFSLRPKKLAQEAVLRPPPRRAPTDNLPCPCPTLLTIGTHHAGNAQSLPFNVGQVKDFGLSEEYLDLRKL